MLAQQRPDPDFLTAAITAMEAQRNSALNAQATAEARLMQANSGEIAELKAKLEPKKETPTDAKQSPKQARLMAAAAHNPAFAKKAGVPKKV